MGLSTPHLCKATSGRSDKLASFEKQFLYLGSTGNKVQDTGRPACDTSNIEDIKKEKKIPVYVNGKSIQQTVGHLE